MELRLSEVVFNTLENKAPELHISVILMYRTRVIRSRISFGTDPLHRALTTANL